MAESNLVDQQRNGEFLTKTELKIVECTVRGMDSKEISQLLDLRRSQVMTIRQLPHVCKAIYTRHSELNNKTSSEGLSIAPVAIKVLEQILTTPTERSSDRIQAAKILIANASKFAETRRLEQKVSSLEKRFFDVSAEEIEREIEGSED